METAKIKGKAMIKQVCWVDGSGTPHTTREKCQQAEIQIAFAQSAIFGIAPELRDSIAQFMVENAKTFVNILTMTETSRPKARGQKRMKKTPEAVAA